MKKLFQNPLICLVAIVLIVTGFKWVTQAGQGLQAIQNDGYAGSGGTLILVGGILFGLWLSSKGKK
jgi:hypothetical protein